MRLFATLACVLAMLLASASAHAQTRVELLGTWPAGDAVTLHHNQNFYLHLRYTSDQPVRIWVQPYFQGEPAKAGTNTSRTYPAGTGEALGWFFLFDAGAQVDSVQIKTGDGSTARTHVIATFPVNVGFDNALVESPPQPGWLTGQLAASEAASRADYEQAMNQSTSAGSIALFSGFMLAMATLGIASFLWPAWGLWRWRDGWRVAALVPMLVMGFVVLRIIADGMRDPTSHNLWPFEIVIWGLACCGWMLALTLARLLLRAGRAR